LRHNELSHVLNDFAKPLMILLQVAPVFLSILRIEQESSVVSDLVSHFVSQFIGGRNEPFRNVDKFIVRVLDSSQGIESNACNNDQEHQNEGVSGDDFFSKSHDLFSQY
jgi:hypothetical protein